MAPSRNKKHLTFRQIFSSILAAAYGVQNSDRLQRDFSKGQAWQFIATGILFTILFVLLILALVQWLLR